MACIPYDHNRVELEDSVDRDDYINASWIGGALLIAAQAPRQNTVKHFLQMLMEQEIEVVVMLGKVLEKNESGIFLCLYQKMFT